MKKTIKRGSNVIIIPQRITVDMRITKFLANEISKQRLRQILAKPQTLPPAA